jgi:hypothetical protein
MGVTKTSRQFRGRELKSRPERAGAGPSLSAATVRRIIMGTQLLTMLVAAGWGCFAMVPSPAAAQTKTDAELIANAVSAAPLAVGREASVIDIDAQGKVRQLRKGSNSFTCIPDTPSTPTNDPVCVDPAGLEWTMAWVNHTEPPKGKVGFGYMLQGGSDPGNEDPFAVTPPAGHEWMLTGPHVMIFDLPEMPAGYPAHAHMEDTNTAQPYVMWPGTAYQHLMIPVQ